MVSSPLRLLWLWQRSLGPAALRPLQASCMQVGRGLQSAAGWGRLVPLRLPFRPQVHTTLATTLASQSCLWSSHRPCAYCSRDCQVAQCRAVGCSAAAMLCCLELVHNSALPALTCPRALCSTHCRRCATGRSTSASAASQRRPAAAATCIECMSTAVAAAGATNELVLTAAAEVDRCGRRQW